MVCLQCGTDTPLPASVCQRCHTPFPPSALTGEPETVAYGSGRARTVVRSLSGLQPGAAFGTRYRILRELGAGGMGIVYQAWDSELGVAVALKVIRPDATDDPLQAHEIEKRFKRELLLARQVTHKNVVRIHDLGEVDGIKYITMPYIEGQDLADMLRDRGRLPVGEAVRLARQIASGLIAAHEAGVVHRDLKPENIMIDGDGQPLIMDFGISRSVVSSTATRTAAGAIVGTLEYMAPEQARGQNVDHRVDIYALGLIMHDMIAGRQRVASSESALTEMMRRMQQAPPPLRTLVADVPEDTERIVSKCLKSDPDERYQTPAQLVADLDALGADGRALPLYRQRQWNPVSATLAVLVLISAGAAVWFWQHRAAPVPPAQREPLSILIADFGNSSQEHVFDGALEQALGISLEGAPFLTSYRRADAQALVKRLNIEKDGRLNEASSRVLAVREGVKVVLSGAIAAEGTGYRVDVRAIDPASGNELTAQHASAKDKAAVLQAVGTVADRLRTALGDTSPDSARRAAAETFTTNSLEALAAYDQAQVLNKTGKPREALQKFQEAVTLDPDFGRAWANMGSIYTNLKQPDKAEECYQHALKTLGRMSEREKYRTYGLYYMSVTKNYDKAVENFETLVKRYPSDNAALTNLALAYLGVGSVQKAADAGRHALEIYPKNLISRTNYATYSMYAGDFDTAVAQAEMVLKERPAYEWANLTLALSKASQGKEDEARAVYGRLRGFSDLGYALAGMGEADLDMYYGRSRHALAVLQDSIARDEAKKNETNLSLKLVAAAEAHLALGDAAKAYQEVERATKTSADESVLVPGAHLLVRLGKTARAEEIAASLGKLLPAHLRAYARIISADVKLSKGNTPEALDDLRAAQQLHDSWYVHWMLGNAYEAASQFTEAASEREICIKRRGEATDMFFADTSTLRSLPPVYYRLGKAQDAVGSADAARGNYQLFLKTREHADPVDVSASDAAERLKALTSGAPTVPAK